MVSKWLLREITHIGTDTHWSRRRWGGTKPERAQNKTDHMTNAARRIDFIETWLCKFTLQLNSAHYFCLLVQRIRLAPASEFAEKKTFKAQENSIFRFNNVLVSEFARKKKWDWLSVMQRARSLK